jgi:hypothetical protein
VTKTETLLPLDPTVFTPTTFRHTKRLPIRISRPSHKKFHFKNISSSVNWGVPHGLHKIAPVSLSLTASIYRGHKLAYVPSLYFYTPWLKANNLT